MAEVINAALQSPPANATHWTVRSMSEHCGVSKSTVARWFELFGVQPHRQRTFKLSNDPFFIEKVRDIVGLYLNPPDHAVVLASTKKARSRRLSAPSRCCRWDWAMSKASPTTMSGMEPPPCSRPSTWPPAKCSANANRAPHQEFLAFLRHIDRNVPKTLDVHLVVDNYATHKHAKVKAWLAKRPRYYIHYTPTYASWLNQVERWFGIITQQAIRRGTFSSVKQLTRKIDRFVNDYNSTNRPFVWTATADSILAKVERLSKLICGTAH